MGGGYYKDSDYDSAKSARAAAGKSDFEYTKSAKSVHPNLDPKRIRNKPFGRLESRDSGEHPESNAVLVSFDVTGSNIDRAVDAQKALPQLMAGLSVLPDVQVAFAANDDFKIIGEHSIQISDFESDIRIDEHLRNIWLTGQGGGNRGESYELILYAAARKTILDCYEKRGKKGYLFLYADEPFFPFVDAKEVFSLFGDRLESDIPIAEIIKEARQHWNVFVIWPLGGYEEAKTMYHKLFGKEYVVELQHPNLICELITSCVIQYEKFLASQAPKNVRATTVHPIPLGSGKAELSTKR